MGTMLPLSEPVYKALMAEIKEKGTTPDAWVTQHLSSRRREPTAEEIAAADAELFRWTVSCDHGTGSDNASIDADLAREYGNDHAPGPQPRAEK